MLCLSNSPAAALMEQEDNPLDAPLDVAFGRAFHIAEARAPSELSGLTNSVQKKDLPTTTSLQCVRKVSRLRFFSAGILSPRLDADSFLLSIHFKERELGGIQGALRRHDTRQIDE